MNIDDMREVYPGWVDEVRKGAWREATRRGRRIRELEELMKDRYRLEINIKRVEEIWGDLVLEGYRGEVGNGYV